MGEAGAQGPLIATLTSGWQRVRQEGSAETRETPKVRKNTETDETSGQLEADGSKQKNLKGQRKGSNREKPTHKA
jgi:hypothetical protein